MVRVPTPAHCCTPAQEDRFVQQKKESSQNTAYQREFLLPVSHLGTRREELRKISKTHFAPPIRQHRTSRKMRPGLHAAELESGPESIEHVAVLAERQLVQNQRTRLPPRGRAPEDSERKLRNRFHR